MPVSIRQSWSIEACASVDRGAAGQIMANDTARVEGPCGRVYGERSSSGDHPASPARRSWVIKRQTVRASSFAAGAAQMAQEVGPTTLSGRLLDAVCLLGSVARCRERLAAFGTAGVELPILRPPVGADGARTVIQAFRR